MPTGNPDDDQSLRARLAELCHSHGQSAVARKVNTSPANVSRYLKGNRIPASFCSKLIRELGVNPAWLMVGEGSTLVSDVAEGTARMGEGVLELVEALNAVTRMRLGALTGKHHLRVLRELNEALKHYEDLRERLNRQSVPIFKRLLYEMREALARKDLDRAAELRQACAQVARLCDAEDMMTDFEAAQGHLAYLNFDLDRAIDHQSRVFIRRIQKAGEFKIEGLIQAHNFVMILGSSGRHGEARRVARAATELAGQHDWQLDTAIAALDIELGDLQPALDKLRRAVTRVRDDYRHNVVQSLVRGQLLEGTISMEQALSFDVDTEAMWSRLLSIAIAAEDTGQIDRLLPLAIGDPPRKLAEDTTLAFAARAVAKPTVGAARAFLKLPRSQGDKWRLASFERHTTAAQLFRLAGRKREALEQLKQAVDAVEPGVQSPVERRITHARNALELVRPAERNRRLRQIRQDAAAFVLEYLQRGYACLEPLREAASA